MRTLYIILLAFASTCLFTGAAYKIKMMQRLNNPLVSPLLLTSKALGIAGVLALCSMLLLLTGWRWALYAVMLSRLALWCGIGACEFYQGMVMTGRIHKVTSPIDAYSLARATATALKDGLVVIDAEGNVRLWNDGAARIFGYTEGEMMGRDLACIIPESYRDRHFAAIKRLREGGQMRLGERIIALEGLRKNGEHFPAELTIIRSSGDGEGDSVYYVAVARDLSNVYRLT